MLGRLKKWLSRSGIHYILLPADHRLAGEEMIDSLNPFDAVVENPAHPWARILRENFFTGIQDTYHVLVGDHYDLYVNGGGRKGVLDILLFPLLARYLLYLTVKRDTPTAVKFIAGFFGVLLEFARQALAVALTICLIPIVVLVHVAAFIPSRILKHKAGKLWVKDARVEDDCKNMGEKSEPTTTSSVALVFIRLSELLIKKNKKISESDIIINEERNPLVQGQYKFGNEHFFSTWFQDGFTIVSDQPDAEQREAMEAFNTLNVGGGCWARKV